MQIKKKITHDVTLSQCEIQTVTRDSQCITNEYNGHTLGP